MTEDLQETAPSVAVDFTTVEGLTTTPFLALVEEDAALQTLIERSTQRRHEISLELRAILLAFPAPKSLKVGEIARVTQTEGSKPRESFDRDVARRLFDQKGVPLTTVDDVFKSATKIGKRGEPGLQIVRVKKAEESSL